MTIPKEPSLKEMAEKIANEWAKRNGADLHRWHHHESARDNLVDNIEILLHQAVLEERKRCAKVAMNFKCEPPDVWDKEIREAIAKEIMKEE